jgi:hypothetical protein
MIESPANVRAVFEFLARNHEYNKKIQEEDIRSTFSPYDNVADRALRLLYEIVNTQSQPKLEPICDFFTKISKRPQVLTGLDSFTRHLDPNLAFNGDLFKVLRDCDGWGDKTSALFIRNLVLIQRNTPLRVLFWEDIDLLDVQPIRLPVDAVIKAVFRQLKRDDASLPNPNFDSINEFLMARYRREEMLVWDDLWFWGFITQRSQPKIAERTFGWNKAKYWSIFAASKGDSEIAKIRELAEEFLALTGCTVNSSRTSDTRRGSDA